MCASSETAWGLHANAVSWLRWVYAAPLLAGCSYGGRPDASASVC